LKSRRRPTGHIDDGPNRISLLHVNHLHHQIAVWTLLVTQLVAQRVHDGIHQLSHCVSQCPIKVENKDPSGHVILGCQGRVVSWGLRAFRAAGGSVRLSGLRLPPPAALRCARVAIPCGLTCGPMANFFLNAFVLVLAG
jgi:hypothetical protein